ncbi:hypothetical protein ZIOFF_008235 [Zingiber officinale]|uniref:Uncharacterized protein n=1 Tax=Zingiber officinale TaxID=94328 RepID=A0A8J5IHW7_ZINOF|nr:hypothetical protein ZIOFF_008235 [Zingiber officinale]
MPLQRIDDVHVIDGLPLGVLHVSHDIVDHVLEEDLEDSVSLLIDESTDALDATPPGQASDRRLSDALDIATEHFGMVICSCPTPYHSSLFQASSQNEQSIYKFLHKFEVILE